MSDWPGDDPQQAGRPDEFNQSAEEHPSDFAATPESTPAAPDPLLSQQGDDSSGPPPAGSSTWDRIGCRDQIILVAASVLLAFFLVTIVALILGFRPNTVTTLRDNMNTLRSENELMQTAVAEIAAGQELLEVLEQELDDNTELLATIEVAVGDNEDAIAAVATVQSERNTQIDQLQERSNQVTSFLELLSEIADRAAGGEELRSPTPFVEATSEPIFTATSTPTDLIGPPEATETVTVTATATSVEDVEAAEATEEETTAQPVRTRSPTVTPTLEATPEDA